MCVEIFVNNVSKYASKSTLAEPFLGSTMFGFGRKIADMRGYKLVTAASPVPSSLLLLLRRQTGDQERFHVLQYSV